ncbi:MAG: 1-acyl-sn-glycerol-3-phosphate acyltransferase [Gammaproteobacteria bacterium]|nr:1-acyl-sn-glycerol-3-phosphate acyltransferase [Gammaproteobacteria bacterium]
MMHTGVAYVRSILFSLGFIVLLILITPVVLIMAVTRIPYTIRYATMRQWARFCIWWLKLTCKIRYEIEGAENIPDEPVIVFSKHQSTWETLFLPSLTSRHQAWILKQELMWVPFFGWAMAAIGTIPIIRGSGRTAIKRIIESGRRYMNEGSWIMVFPEGTRVAPGEEKRFGIGGAMLAASTSARVLPVAHNAGEFWPRKGFIKYAGTIRVVIGEPIDTADMKADTVNEVIDAWMRQAMHKINPAIYPLSKTSQ